MSRKQQLQAGQELGSTGFIVGKWAKSEVLFEPSTGPDVFTDVFDVLESHHSHARTWKGLTVDKRLYQEPNVRPNYFSRPLRTGDHGALVRILQGKARLVSHVYRVVFMNYGDWAFLPPNLSFFRLDAPKESTEVLKFAVAGLKAR